MLPRILGGPSSSRMQEGSPLRFHLLPRFALGGLAGTTKTALETCPCTASVSTCKGRGARRRRCCGQYHGDGDGGAACAFLRAWGREFFEWHALADGTPPSAPAFESCVPCAALRELRRASPSDRWRVALRFKCHVDDIAVDAAFVEWQHLLSSHGERSSCVDKRLAHTV